MGPPHTSTFPACFYSQRNAFAEMMIPNQAEQAVKFYTSVYKNSKIGQISRYGDAGPGPAGSVMTASFELEGLQFTALNAGPAFNFTPAISFFVSCETEDELDRIWAQLSTGGKVLMPLGEYPFSKKFGWLEDQYGLTWQLNLSRRAQKIIPFLLFVGKQHGKAEEAMQFYTSLFKDSAIEMIIRYGPGQYEPEGTVMQAVFRVDGQEFMAMDSAWEHQFAFTEAISLYVNCETQAEVDYLWERLGEGGDEAAQQCGWLKDRFGLSWQIVPSVLIKLLNDPDPVKARRVTEAMLQMKKIEIPALERAHETA
jgi:predicted 3-demethylubiquinone-9 3-methyltransferase (glyoxalase superfamily)